MRPSTAALALAMEQRAGSVDAVDLFPEREDWRRNADGTHPFEGCIRFRGSGAYTEQRVWAGPYEREIVLVYARFARILDAFTVYHDVDRAISGSVIASGRYETGKQLIRKMLAARGRSHATAIE